MTTRAARFINQGDLGAIQYGNRADCVLVNPNETKEFNDSNWLSAGRNSPLIGATLPGQILENGRRTAHRWQMMDRVTQLKHHFTAIEHTIRMAEANAAREKQSVRLLAVSKTKPATDIEAYTRSDKNALARTTSRGRRKNK